jgi:hypothetical protein
VTRRRLLLAGVAALAALVAFLTRRWTLPEAEVAMPALPEPESPAARLIPARDQELLLRVADVIVPGDGDSPSARGIDLLPRLERWVASAPGRRDLYTSVWPQFAGRVRALVGPEPAAADLERLCWSWFRAYRDGSADEVGRFFEQLRRDVLRVYWASPTGWAAVGYGGPAHGPVAVHSAHSHHSARSGWPSGSSG